MDSLPPELISQVMVNLPIKSLLNLRLTNRNLNYISRDDQLWLEIAKREAKYPELFELLMYAREILPRNSIEFLWLNIKEGRAFKGSEFLFGWQRNFYSAGQQASIQLYNYFMRIFNIKEGIELMIYGAAQSVDKTLFVNLLTTYMTGSFEKFFTIYSHAMNLAKTPKSGISIEDDFTVAQLNLLFPPNDYEDYIHEVGHWERSDPRGISPPEANLELISISPQYLDLFEPISLNASHEPYLDWIIFYNRIPNLLKSKISFNYSSSIEFGYLPTLFHHDNLIISELNKTTEDNLYNHTDIFSQFNIYYYLKYKGFLDNFSVKKELEYLLSLNLPLPILPIVILWSKDLFYEECSEYDQIISWILSSYRPTLETLTILFKFLTPNQILNKALLVSPQSFRSEDESLLIHFNDQDRRVNSHKLTLFWVNIMLQYSAIIREEDKLKILEMEEYLKNHMTRYETK